MDSRERHHPRRRSTGAAAEHLAARFLQGRGIVVLARNVRVGGGEIDIVARVGGETAVVEVRSRWAVGREESPDPLEAFDAAKVRQVRKLAATLPPSMRTSRVDLIAVRFGEEGVELLWTPRVAARV